jgi:hypothetical protein
MKRCIIEAKNFTKSIDDLIAKKKLLPEDFDALKRSLAQKPEEGDLITGTGGVRKTRLKSSSKGKSGGFRVCYFDDKDAEELFLILIYPKNEQENLTSHEKKALKELTNAIKKR